MLLHIMCKLYESIVKKRFKIELKEKPGGFINCIGTVKWVTDGAQQSKKIG